ncbi:MAG: ribonuclease J [Holosporales bacterium]|jgi:ribonuclease J|nr:ribonuclease J [Holosporales bacterium]
MSRKTKGTKTSYIPGCNDLLFLPLGGTNEIGMNFSMLGHDGEWLVIDCGVTFNNSFGIDIITPDPTFAVTNNSKIKGIFVTHAHEDHIGAIEYLWPILKCPVYVTPFAAAILKRKIETKSWASKVNIIKLKFNKKMDIGKFNIEAIQMTHSIPEPAAFVIKTPLGTVVHTGDWNLDQNPTIGEKVNENKLAKIGKDGVLAYFCDSTNIFVEENLNSESIIRENLINLVSKHKDKRITVACFASNIARVESVILAAQKADRKIAVIGRSLKRMLAAAQETGYLTQIPKLIDEKAAMSMPSEKVLMLCTGSQGENLSALVRIASSKHPIVKMGEKDIVFFSSRVIPGNEKSIGELHNILALQKVDIITSSEENIHASGHASIKIIGDMYKLLQPRIVVPVHGEARHIIAQSHFARKSGIPIVITPYNGALIQLAGETPKIIKDIPVGRWAVDGNRMVNFNGNIIKERIKLSEEGAVFTTVIVEKNGIKKINVSVIGLEEYGKPISELVEYINDSVIQEFSGIVTNNPSNTKSIAQYIFSVIDQKFDKKPVVEVHIVTV